MSCTYRNSFMESDDFYEISLKILSVIQVPLHVFGAYIVVMKTPKTMATVKFPILLVHLTCAWFDIYLTILTIPVIIFPIISGYPLGLLYYLGVPIWMMTYIGLTSLFLLACAILMFFENRYHHLVRLDSETLSRKRKRAVQYFLNYLLAFTAFIPLFIDIPDRKKAREIAFQNLPCLPSTIIDNPRFLMLNLNVYIIRSCCLIYIFIVWSQGLVFFIGTASYIFKTKSQSKQTTKLQKQFFKALCIQIAVPFIVIMIPGIYILYVLFSGILDMALSNISIIWLSTHGLFSTIVMLIVHKPYRQATLELLRLTKTDVASNPYFVFNQPCLHG